MIAKLCTLLSILYLLIVIIKSIYFGTKDAEHILLLKINKLTTDIIEFTFFKPLDWIWNNIIYIDTLDLIPFYSTIAVPLIVILVSTFFISDYSSLKSKYNVLRKQIQEEIDLRDMRKQAGIESVPENATVDIVIDGAKNDDPAWHNTGWGKVLIGVSIAVIVTSVGLK